jgi:hypothetical protein
VLTSLHDRSVDFFGAAGPDDFLEAEKMNATIAEIPNKKCKCNKPATVMHQVILSPTQRSDPDYFCQACFTMMMDAHLQDALVRIAEHKRMLRNN